MSMGSVTPFRSDRGRRRRSRPLLRRILGRVLRRTRLAQGRTLSDVARAARISMPYLSEVERGRKEASSEVLAAVCDALRIELADVLVAVRQDLIAHDADAAPVVRLGMHSHRSSSGGPSSSDPVCAVAA